MGSLQNARPARNAPWFDRLEATHAAGVACQATEPTKFRIEWRLLRVFGMVVLAVRRWPARSPASRPGEHYPRRRKCADTVSLARLLPAGPQWLEWNTGPSARGERKDQRFASRKESSPFHSSKGVPSWPRSTMSQRKPSDHSGSVNSRSKLEIRRLRAFSSGMEL